MVSFDITLAAVNLVNTYDDVNVIPAYYLAVLTTNIPTVSTQSHNSVFKKVLTYLTVHYREDKEIPT